MSDFVVTIDNNIFSVNTSKTKKVIINGSEQNLEIVKLSAHTYKIILDNKIFHVTTSKLANNKFSFLIDGHYFETLVRTKLEEEVSKVITNAQNNNGVKIIKSPMPGLILRLEKQVGDEVKEGEPLILLEAMKMENEIRSTASGIISEINIKEGESVEKNQILLIIN